VFSSINEFFMLLWVGSRLFKWYGRQYNTGGYLCSAVAHRWGILRFIKTVYFMAQLVNADS
jgi:hypothetical protein